MQTYTGYKLFINFNMLFEIFVNVVIVDAKCKYFIRKIYGNVFHELLLKFKWICTLILYEFFYVDVIWVVFM